jgi:hypothetical protein
MKVVGRALVKHCSVSISGKVVESRMVMFRVDSWYFVDRAFELARSDPRITRNILIVMFRVDSWYFVDRAFEP